MCRMYFMEDEDGPIHHALHFTAFQGKLVVTSRCKPGTDTASVLQWLDVPWVYKPMEGPPQCGRCSLMQREPDPDYVLERARQDAEK